MPKIEDSTTLDRPVNAAGIWESALGSLQLEVNKSNFRTWFAKTTGMSFQDGTFTIGVPNAFVAAYLEKNQRSLIERTVIGLTESDTRVSFCITGAGSNDGGAATAHPQKPAATGLNSRYTFAAFIAGEGNRLAKAAAMEIARHPGESYNPLYIHSACGLGKTHLLHAIGHAAGGDGRKVLYVSAERFTNEFVQALRQQRTEDFHNKYRNVDMLLIDDIQFLSGKAQTEESFFHTFNELHNNGRQIVITCDCPPGSIPIEERLRSRLAWGLTVDIQPPAEATRKAILADKADEYGTVLPDDVLGFMASKAVGSIRELEGSLNRLVAYLRLIKSPPTVAIARRALRSIADPGNGGNGHNTAAPPVSPRQIMDHVAEAFQVSYDDVIGRKRDRRSVLARQVAMYLLKHQGGLSLACIGASCGGRDHSTVIHAVSKVAGELNDNPQLERIISDIRRKLR